MTTTQGSVDRLLLKPSEAAQAMGVCERTLWGLDIPRIKIGRSVRYDVRDLEAWIERNRVSDREPVRGKEEVDANGSSHKNEQREGTGTWVTILRPGRHLRRTPQVYASDGSVWTPGGA